MSEKKDNGNQKIIGTTGKTLFDWLDQLIPIKWIRIILLVILILLIVFIIIPLNYSYQQGKKGREVSIGFSGIHLGQDPYIASNIENTCNAGFPTFLVQLPTSKPDPIFSISPTPRIASTSTMTPSPTSNSTLAPNSTSTPTPTSTYGSEEFSNSCIPDTWQIYPTYLMEYLQITPGPCPKYDKVGLSGLETGLQIVAQPKSKDQMTSGTYRKLPSGDFEIQVRFSDLTLLPPKDGRTSFYIFFFNSKDANGEKSISSIENSYYFSNTNPDGLPFLLFEKTPVAYSIESSNDILLTCEKQSLLVKCDLIGTETTSSLQEFTFDPSWDSILVGYYSDQYGYVKVNISHFQIIPK